MFADTMLSAGCPNAVRSALREPAPDTGCSDLQEPPGLARGHQFGITLTDRTEGYCGSSYDPLALDGDNFRSSLHPCHPHLLRYNGSGLLLSCMAQDAAYSSKKFDPNLEKNRKTFGKCVFSALSSCLWS